MDFRNWYLEWEGMRFPGNDSEFYNSELYPNSRYKGKGLRQSPPSNLKKVDKMFGFKPKYVFKKMKRK